jgi:hypothetical protein
MYSVTLKAGLVDVVLPNGNRYQGGDTVALSDTHYGQMSAATRAAVFATAPSPASSATQELFRATGLTLNASSDIVTANTVNQATGKTGVIDVSAVQNGLLVVSVASVSGTTPGLAVFFDCQDAAGNWVQTSAPTSIGGVVLNASGYTYGVINNGYRLTHKGRIRWTVTGTGSPTFNGVTFSLFGS